MHATTFDTLEFTEQLKAAGVPDEQAKGHAKALTSVMRQTETHIDERIEKRDKQSEGILDGMATRGDLKELDAKIESSKSELKRDIKELELRIAADMAKIHGELATMRWGIAIIVGGIIALILKSFFPH